MGCSALGLIALGFSTLGLGVTDGEGSATIPALATGFGLVAAVEGLIGAGRDADAGGKGTAAGSGTDAGTSTGTAGMADEAVNCADEAGKAGLEAGTAAGTGTDEAPTTGFGVRSSTGPRSAVRTSVFSERTSASVPPSGTAR